MTHVTFINPLSVPSLREAEFLAKWDEGAAYVRDCKGFVSTSLHRSLTPDSRFQFFTVAAWESADDFRAAMATDWWRDYVSRFGFGSTQADFGASPHICERVRGES